MQAALEVLQIKKKDGTRQNYNEDYLQQAHDGNAFDSSLMDNLDDEILCGGAATDEMMKDEKIIIRIKIITNDCQNQNYKMMQVSVLFTMMKEKQIITMTAQKNVPEEQFI